MKPEIHRSPVSILKENFGRSPLDCTRGPVRNNLGESASIRAVECSISRVSFAARIFISPPSAEEIRVSHLQDETDYSSQQP